MLPHQPTTAPLGPRSHRTASGAAHRDWDPLTAHENLGRSVLFSQASIYSTAKFLCALEGTKGNSAILHRKCGFNGGLLDVVIGHKGKGCDFGQKKQLFKISQPTAMPMHIFACAQTRVRVHTEIASVPACTWAALGGMGLNFNNQSFPLLSMCQVPWVHYHMQMPQPSFGAHILCP